MSNEYEYPAKIKQLVEEIRFAKDKIKELEEKSRKDSKTAMMALEYRVKLEEACRDLKLKIKTQINPPDALDVS
jgi:hypothetical protein